MSGYLHISQLRGGDAKSAEELLSIGEEVRVRALSMNMKTGVVELSMLATGGDVLPFQGVASSEWLEGKVESVQQYAAEVEVTAPGGKTAVGSLALKDLKGSRVTDVRQKLQVGD